MNVWKEKYGEKLLQIHDSMKNSLVIKSADNSFDVSSFENSKFDVSRIDDVKNLLTLKESLMNHANGNFLLLLLI